MKRIITIMLALALMPAMNVFAQGKDKDKAVFKPYTPGFYQNVIMKDNNGQMWYLIKDSSSGSRNVDPKSPEFGYYFFSTPYVKVENH